ncbi:MAG: DUF58 domain-containing protein [Anaerolineae bacterium]
MMRSSIRVHSYVPLVLAGAMLFSQVFSPNPAVKVILVVMLGLTGVSYYWARQMAGHVTVERQKRYGWAQVGDILEQRFTMRNSSWMPVLWAEAYDHSNLPGYNPGRAIGFGGHGSNRWSSKDLCTARGVYTLGPLDLKMGDPFGIFEVLLSHDQTESFIIYPAITALPFSVEPYGIVRGSSRVNVRTFDLTTNASSVRNYVPGDALNRIHWRSTARRSMPDREEILVKEFDFEPSGDLWIVLDLTESSHVGQDENSTEEFAVTLAGSLASQLLAKGHGVGLVAYGSEPLIVPPQKGQQQLWGLLHALAGVHAQAKIGLGEVLNQVQPLLGRHVSVAIITPGLDGSWLDGMSTLISRGIRVSTLLLDTPTFGGQGDAQALRAALADVGVPTQIIDRDFRPPRINPPRQQQPEYKVLGTGRVVVVDPGDEASREWVPLGQGDK